MGDENLHLPSSLLEPEPVVSFDDLLPPPEDDLLSSEADRLSTLSPKDPLLLLPDADALPVDFSSDEEEMSRGR